MKKLKKWFSIVEIIITISIIIILSIVATTSYSSFQDKTKNSKVSSDIKTLENSILSYIEEQKELFMPKWNLKFYSFDTWYTHDYADTETFWVSWYITEDVISKKYLNFLPLDPRTNQYYAFGKTKSWTWFEVSWVIFENNIPSSIVSGNWTGETGVYSLVKEYLWPNFVFDKSKEYFPYNPEENIITAKIDSFSGVVKINDKTYNENEILLYTLRQWDKITVGSWWFANIYYSDGSFSALWDSSSQSELVLSNMNITWKNNLFTSIRLALNMWSVWTKAVKLDEKSEFEIYTTDAVAAVRWTIFWVRKDVSGSNIVVVRWKVEVSKVSWVVNIEDLDKKLKKEENINKEMIYIPWWNSPITQENNKSYIKVEAWEKEKWVSIWETDNSSSTGAINKTPEEINKRFIKNTSFINPDMKIYASCEDCNTSNFKLIFQLNDAFKNASYLKVKTFSWGKKLLNANWKNFENLLLTWWINFNISSTWTTNSTLQNIITSSRYKVSFSFCDRFLEKEVCSNEFEYDQKNIASNFKKIRENIKSVCFWVDWRYCTENNLRGSWQVVAYAPYDEVGDIKMYTWSWSNNHITPEQQAVTINSCIPLKDGNNNWFKNDGCLTNDIIINNNNNNWLWQNTSYDTDNSFFDIPQISVKWIFIDNKNNNDYLKYTLPPDLISWSGFAIEMSVRGGALKRRDATNNNPYTLFSFYSGGYLTLNHWNFNINGNNLDNNTIFNINNDNDNDFYKVIFINNWNLSIFDKSNGKIYSTWSNLTINTSWDFYVWSNKYNSEEAYIQQWNDIIDYVKIYKKQ